MLKLPNNSHRWLMALLPTLILAGCSREPAIGPEIHDTKYRAVDAKGEVQDAAIAPGVCTLDTYTQLTWEVKESSPGLRSRDNTYSWYNPNEANDELDYRGVPDGGQCEASACDTWSFVAAVNESALCGYRDWRLPSRDELGSLSDPRLTGSPPTINIRYFPNTQAGDYWSANDYQFQYDSAWLWSFQTGLDRVEWKKSPRYLRLVRGQPVQVERVKD
jgi:hypothetical protein